MSTGCTAPWGPWPSPFLAASAGWPWHLLPPRSLVLCSSEICLGVWGGPWERGPARWPGPESEGLRAWPPFESPYTRPPPSPSPSLLFHSPLRLCTCSSLCLPVRCFTVQLHRPSPGQGALAPQEGHLVCPSVPRDRKAGEHTTPSPKPPPHLPLLCSFCSYPTLHRCGGHKANTQRSSGLPSRCQRCRRHQSRHPSVRPSSPPPATCSSIHPFSSPSVHTPTCDCPSIVTHLPAHRRPADPSVPNGNRAQMGCWAFSGVSLSTGSELPIPGTIQEEPVNGGKAGLTSGCS